MRIENAFVNVGQIASMDQRENKWLLDQLSFQECYFQGGIF